MPEIDRAAACSAGLGLQLVLQARDRGAAARRASRRAGGAGRSTTCTSPTARASRCCKASCSATPDGLRWGFAQRPAEGVAAVEALRAALEEGSASTCSRSRRSTKRSSPSWSISLGLAGIDAAQLAPLLARHTGGNPMYALETLKHLIVSDADALDAGLPRPAERRPADRAPAAPAVAAGARAGACRRGRRRRLLDRAGRSGARHRAHSRSPTPGASSRRRRCCAATRSRTTWSTRRRWPACRRRSPRTRTARSRRSSRRTAASRRASPRTGSTRRSRGARSPRCTPPPTRPSARCGARRKRSSWRARRRSRARPATAAAFDSWHAMIDALWVADLTALDAAMFDRLDARRRRAPSQRAAAQALRAQLAAGARRTRAGEAARPLRGRRWPTSAGDEATAAYARQRLAQMLDWDGDYDAALALLQPLLPWAAERASEYGAGGVLLPARRWCSTTPTAAARRASITSARSTSRRKVGEWGGVVTVLGNLAISWASAGYMQRAIELLREALQLAAAHDEARGCGASLPAEMYKRAARLRPLRRGAALGRAGAGGGAGRASRR